MAIFESSSDDNIQIKLTYRYQNKYLGENTKIKINGIATSVALKDFVNKFFHMMEMVKNKYQYDIINYRYKLSGGQSFDLKILNIVISNNQSKSLCPTKIFQEKGIYYIDITDMYNELQSLLKQELHEENIRKMSNN